MTRHSNEEANHPSGNSRLWQIYDGMKKRCYQKGDKDYKKYGAKGIQLCPEWKCSYVAFRRWALANGYAEDLSIDRIDSSKGYSPDNCRWIGWFENVTRNAVPITAWGETKFIWEWMEDPRCKASKANLRMRLWQGWTPEEAIATPVRPRFSKLDRLLYKALLSLQDLADFDREYCGLDDNDELDY